MLISENQNDPVSSLAQKPSGWPEVAVALTTYILCLVPLTLMLFSIPDEQAGLRGIAGMGMNGVAGTVALFAAFSLRIRNLRAFGFRSAERKWLLAGLGLGVFAFVVSFAIEGIYFHFITEPNTQGDFQAAAKGGALSFIALLITGAILTPFGEEVVFRGIVANVLNKYGVWAGVIGSSAIFALVHGPSVIFVLAFFVGILAAILFRKTQSIWPGFVLHAVYNGLHLIYYATL